MTDRDRLEVIDQTVWQNIHIRAHLLRSEQPEWAVENLGPMPEEASLRRDWGVFAARLEQHRFAYSEVVDHKGAYESHREIVDDILDQMTPARVMEIGLSIDL